MDIFPNVETHHNVVVLSFLLVLLVFLLGSLIFRKVPAKAIIISSLPIVSRFGKPRFRKRDKIRYYAARFGRKLHSFTEKVQKIKSQDDKQKYMMMFAKRILNIKQRGPMLVQRSLPETFFEPELEEDDSNLPDEFKLMMRSIRVFGHLEKPFFIEFCKNIQTISMDSGQYLFKIGDPDDSIFVVQTGKLRVFILDPDGTELTIHEVVTGGTIHSLLSVLDVLTGNPAPFKTVQASAVTASIVLRLPAKAFLDIFQRYPDTLVRVVQMIAVRLQRVTFMALHNYLGLSSELISQCNLALADSDVVAYNASLQSRLRQRANTFSGLQPTTITASGTMPRATASHRASMTETTLGNEQQIIEEAMTMAADAGVGVATGHAASHDGLAPGDSAAVVEQPVTASAAPAPHSPVHASHRPAKLVRGRHRSRSQSPLGLLGRQMSNVLSDEALDFRGENSGAADSGSGAGILIHGGESLELGEAPECPQNLRHSSSVVGLSSSGGGDSGSVAGSPLGLKSEREDMVAGGSEEATSGDAGNAGSGSGTPRHHKRREKCGSAATAGLGSLSGSGAILDPTTQASTTESGGGHDEESYNFSAMLLAAHNDLVKLMGLEDPHLLDDKLAVTTIPAGATLVRENETQAELYFVVTGELHMFQHVVRNQPSNRVTTLFVCRPGELAGLIGLVTGEPSFYTIRSLAQAHVVIITRQLFITLVRQQPNIMLRLGNLVARRMSPFLRQIDYALEWTSVKAGRPIYQQGDLPDCVYIVLNGRFRQVVVRPDGSREMVAELGRGELLGFLEVLSNQPRVTTIIAIRDSEVAQIPSDLLNWIKWKAPQVVSRLIQLLSDKLLRNLLTTQVGPGGPQGAVKPSGAMANLRAIAVLPASPEVPVEAFTLELQHAMSTIGASVRLTSAIIQKRMGIKALDSVNEYRLSSWLSQQEDLHRMVFYVCDNHPQSMWTRRCIRQADCVLVVGLAKSDPRLLTPMETALASDQTKVAKVLVLLYPRDTDYPTPGRTADWLNARRWITQHFHVRAPPRVFSRRRSDRLVEFYKRVFDREVPNQLADMSRLARYLTGTAVGLVLGGGGARGCSHVGIIRAFQEVGIPIDMVGGTSIGSLMGALWAEETRVTQFTQRAREFAKGMTSVWNKLLDITYPSVSMFSGQAFNKALERIFRDRQIEDLWIPYFCITTDISNSKMRVHTNGSLWRYVRASMSLSGYLPPLCDPYDGSLLLDGGYVNNVPADVMHSHGVQTIFAVDVGSHDDTDLTNYGDWLSGWWLLYRRFIRGANPIRVPNMTEIQSRLAYVSCVRQLEQVKESGICEFLRPPIEKYQTLQFGAFDEICEVGYEYAKQKVLEWKKKDRLRHFTRQQSCDLGGSTDRRFLSVPGAAAGTGGLSGVPCSTAASTLGASSSTAADMVGNLVLGSKSLYEEQRNFIDLAELVSRFDQKEDYVFDSDTEEEWWSSYPEESAGGQITKSRAPVAMEMSKVNSPGPLPMSAGVRESGGDAEEDGYDEDIEEGDPTMTASDPETFNQAIMHHHGKTRKRRHRRASLDRIRGKQVTFEQVHRSLEDLTHD